MRRHLDTDLIARMEYIDVDIVWATGEVDTESIMTKLWGVAKQL